MPQVRNEGVRGRVSSAPAQHLRISNSVAAPSSVDSEGAGGAQSRYVAPTPLPIRPMAAVKLSVALDVPWA